MRASTGVVERRESVPPVVQKVAGLTDALFLLPPACHGVARAASASSSTALA